MDSIKIEKKDVKMVAHRGLSGLERENTCPAFVAAGNRSYYGIETDVHVTKDGKFVIIHDETTDRVSNKEFCINVEENDYAALENVVLPDIDGSRNRQDIRIPLLCDYISICKKYEKIAVLELKNEFTYDDLVRILDEIKALGYIDGVTFISFSWYNCVTVRQLLPDSTIQFLTSKEVDDELIKNLVDNKLDLDIYYKRITDKQIVDKLHSAGIKVNVWTCDTKEEAEALIDMGVDFITSNILE